MPKRLDRTELYGLVWLEPISTLAPNLNVSDARLKKTCAEAHIPLPGRIYWAKRRAGKVPAQTILPIRPAGMSEDVVLGGTHLSWLQTLSDAEILQWPVNPPHFPEDIAVVRDRVRGEMGRVEVPTTWDDAHSEVRRLKRTDAGRQERQRRTSVMFPWEAPRFDSALGQRQLRILNAIFLGAARVGAKGQVSGCDRLETSGRRHLWVSEKREALQKRLAEERASSEAAARDCDEAIGRARTENLLGMARNYGQARTIRLFVSAMRRRFQVESRMATQADFDGWCDRALAQADDLDPVRKLGELLMSRQVPL
jgi:hypothetical protein